MTWDIPKDPRATWVGWSYNLLQGQDHRSISNLPCGVHITSPLAGWKIRVVLPRWARLDTLWLCLHLANPGLLTCPANPNTERLTRSVVTYHLFPDSGNSQRSRATSWADDVGILAEVKAHREGSWRITGDGVTKLQTWLEPGAHRILSWSPPTPWLLLLCLLNSNLLPDTEAGVPQAQSSPLSSSSRFPLFYWTLSFTTYHFQKKKMDYTERSPEIIAISIFSLLFRMFF